MELKWTFGLMRIAVNALSYLFDVRFCFKTNNKCHKIDSLKRSDFVDVVMNSIGKESCLFLLFNLIKFIPNVIPNFSGLLLVTTAGQSVTTAGQRVNNSLFSSLGFQFSKTTSKTKNIKKLKIIFFIILNVLSLGKNTIQSSTFLTFTFLGSFL